MHYILLTELENTSFTTCKIQGLQSDDWRTLESELSSLNVPHSKQDNFHEVDIPGIQILNILTSNQYNYRVISQSMTMEKTNIGGRTIQVQKLVWTLCKN